MPNRKQIYHPCIPFLYYLGLLDNSFTENIPNSTLNNWKNRKYNNLLGADQVSKYFKNQAKNSEFITSNNLKVLVLSAYRIYHVYATFILSINIKRSDLEKHQHTFIQTIDQVKNTIGFNRALKIFRISNQQFYRWKNKVKCKEQKKFMCRKKNRLQLSNKEIKTISSYLFGTNYLLWPLSAIYYQMLRNNDAAMSLTTFYKYACLLGYKNIVPANRRKKHAIGIRASKPFEILHADVTIFKPLDQIKVYIYFIVDNYSRNILAWRASTKLSAQISFENLHDAYNTYNLKQSDTIKLITDNGSENKAQVDDYISTINMQRLIAQKDILFSNSIVESSFNKLKYQFLYTQNLFDINDTKNYLEKAIPDYCNRPHTALFGLTPIEVCNGLVPSKNLFQKQKILARKIRIEDNKNCIECL